MKTCTCCLTEKAQTEFYRATRAKDGLTWWCKQCLKAAVSRRYAAKRKQILAQQREYESKNKDHRRAIRQRWNDANKERKAEYMRFWRKANRERLQARRRERSSQTAEQRALARAAYRAQRGRSKVSFDPELDALVFSEARRLAARRLQMFGFPWHLDHIVPLRAKEACGLHVAYNIDVAPAKYNVEKKNRLAEPRAWL